MIRWYPTLINDNGLLKHISVTIDSLIICHQGPEFRKFANFQPLYTFGNHILKESEKNRCFYEVIQGNSFQKPYFDIDISDPEITDERSRILIDDLKKSILQDTRIFLDDILVFTSHGANKLSYHVVINNWCLPDYNSNKIYCHKIIDRMINLDKKFIDNLVYKSIQQFRTFGSTKRDKDRMKILIDEPFDSRSPNFRSNFFITLMKSLVTNTNSCKVLEYTELVKKIYSDECKEISKEEIEIIENLDCIKNDIFRILDTQGRMVFLKRLKKSYCDICKRDHENENPYLIVNINEIYFYCRRTLIDKTIIWTRDNTNVSKDLSVVTPDSVEEKSSDQKLIKTLDFIKKFLGKR